MPAELDATDTALQNSWTQSNKVRELALQAANAGSMDQTARKAIAVQVDEIRKSVINEANRTYLGRPVFGGTTKKAVASTPVTTSFIGDPESVQRGVAEGVSIRVDAPADKAFGTGAGGNPYFGILADISTHAVNDPAALTADLDRLDKAMSGIREAQADVGARANRIQDLQAVAKQRIDSSNELLSGIEGVDIAEATVNLQMQQVAYQAALSTAGKVLQMSLNNFSNTSCCLAPNLLLGSLHV